MNPDHEKMLNEVLGDESDVLSARAIEFIESLDKKRQYDLSDKQVVWLEDIWNKVFG